MRGNKISERLEKDLMSYVTLLGSKVFDGITYLSIKNNSKNQKLLNMCNSIWDNVRVDGFNENTLFRRFYVGDDVIFDLDLKVCIALGNKVLTNNLNSLGIVGLDTHVGKLNKKSSNIRKLEIERLVNYLGSNISKESIDLILYSDTKDAKISILGRYKDKENMLFYDCFRLRHWDLANLNDILLPKYGKGVDSITMCEVLANVGLRVSITLR